LFKTHDGPFPLLHGLFVCSIKNNAEELGQYLREMGAWESAVKKRDKVLALKRGGGSAAARPPVRAGGGLVPVGATALLAPASVPLLPPPPPARGQTSAAAAGLTREKSAAQHTYDKGYKKWEAFDVSAAERAVDAAQEPSDGEGSLSAPAEPFHNGDPVYPPPRRPNAATRAEANDDDEGEVAPRTPADLAHASMAAPTTSGGAAVPKPRPALMSVQEREVRVELAAHTQPTTRSYIF
jgi:hypothetical protein